MPNPLARHRTRQVVDAGFGDGVGGVGLGMVDDIAGHRGGEDDGGGGNFGAGDDISIYLCLGLVVGLNFRQVGGEK